MTLRRAVALVLLLASAVTSAAGEGSEPPIAPVQGVALRGTLVFSDPALSRAIVAFGPGDERIVTVGMELPQLGVLTAVEPSRIMVSRGGTVYQFRFNDSAPVDRGSGGAVASLSPAVPLPTTAPVAVPGYAPGRDDGNVDWTAASKQRRQTSYTINRDPVTGRVLGATRNDP